MTPNVMQTDSRASRSIVVGRMEPLRLDVVQHRRRLARHVYAAVARSLALSLSVSLSLSLMRWLQP